GGTGRGEVRGGRRRRSRHSNSNRECVAGFGWGRRAPGIRVTARTDVHVRTRGRGTSLCRLPRIPGARRPLELAGLYFGCDGVTDQEQARGDVAARRLRSNRDSNSNSECVAGFGRGRRAPGIRVTARTDVHVRTRGRGTSLCRLPRIPGA